MAYLNWKSANLTLERSSHPKLETQLELTLPPDERMALAEALSQAFANSEELRMDLPENWTVFWKSRVGSSRITLAHPQVDEWVATLVLSPLHAERIVEKIRTLSSSQNSFAFSTIVPAGVLSNFELVVHGV